MCFDDLQDIFQPGGFLAGPRLHFNKVFTWVEAMGTQVCFKHVLVGRKSFGLTDYFCTFSLRPVKTHHHQVKVYRELVHHRDLRRFRAYDLRQGLLEVRMVVHPWIIAHEESFHAVVIPLPQDFFNIPFCTRGLQAKGVSQEICLFLSVVRGNQELIAEPRQWIIPVALRCVCAVWLHRIHFQ
jgi:hypothetical protein